MKSFLFFISSLFIVQQGTAQTDSTATAADSSKKIKLALSVNYLSNSVYLGRKDSLPISYLTPGLKVSFPSGVFFSANASYLTQDSRIDLFTLEGGYDYSRGNLEGTASLTKYFYNNASQNVKADLSASVNTYLAYDLVVKPSLSGYISMGANKPDYTATFGLEHSFATTDETFTFTPSVYANASTQNYYDGYYQTRRFGKGRRGRTVTTTAKVIDAAKFKVLDYELLATAEYKPNAFSFFIEPTYAIPVNPAVVAITVKPQTGPATTQTVTEKIGNSFYISVGVGYDFVFKKKAKR